jgi:hypothetical protein
MATLAERASDEPDEPNRNLQVTEPTETGDRTEHTPGPWVVEVVKGSYQRPALVMSGTKVVASCLGDQLDPGASSIREATANAHLIAVAPELYEYLSRRANEGDEEARRLLAKAEGRKT